MAEGGERRKSQRIRFETRVDLVYKGVNGFASVRTGNLSAGGMFVMLSQPPAPGTRVDFGLMVGAKGLHRGTAEVMWVRPADAAAEHPAGFGMRFSSFQDGSAELIAELVAETLAGAEEPTDHGEEAPAPAETLANRIPTAPIEVAAEAGAKESRSESDRTTTVMKLDLPAEAAGEPASPEPVQVEGAAGGSAPQSPPAPGAGEPAGVATVMAPIADLAAGEAVSPTEPAAAAPSAVAHGQTVVGEEVPAGFATVVASVAELKASVATAPPGETQPPPPSNEAEPQATTMIDVRQAMAAMHEFRAEAAGAEGQPGPTASAPAASTAPQAAPAPTPPAKADSKPPDAGAKPAASPAATLAPETKPAPAAKAAPGKAAAEPATSSTKPAKPAPAPAAAKPAPAPEVTKEPAAPVKAVAKTKRTGPPVSKGLIRLAVLVLVAGAVYLVCTQTQWGRETTPVAVAWAKDTFASVKGRVAPSDTEPTATSPVVQEPSNDAADQIADVNWTSDGPTTLITITANRALGADQVLHQEFARPPRSLVRVKGMRKPFSGFQERTDVPHLVVLKVGHHFELNPPEVFIVAEPESGAKVTRVEVSGSTILIEVTIPPTPKPKAKRGR